MVRAAQMPHAGDGPAFFAVATPWSRWLPKPMDGLLGGFSVSATGSVTPPCGYGPPPGLRYSIAWCCLLLLPWSFYWAPGRRQARLLAAGLVAQAPRAFPVGPFAWLVSWWCCCSLLPLATNGWHILARWCLQERAASAGLEIPLPGTPRPLAPDWPQRGWAAQLPGASREMRLPCFAPAGRPPIRPTRISPGSGELRLTHWLSRSCGWSLLLVFSLLVQKGSPALFLGPNLAASGLLLLVGQGLAPLNAGPAHKRSKIWRPVLAGTGVRAQRRMLYRTIMRTSVVYTASNC